MFWVEDRFVKQSDTSSMAKRHAALFKSNQKSFVRFSTINSLIDKRTAHAMRGEVIR